MIEVIPDLAPLANFTCNGTDVIVIDWIACRGCASGKSIRNVVRAVKMNTRLQKPLVLKYLRMA